MNRQRKNGWGRTVLRAVLLAAFTAAPLAGTQLSGTFLRPDGTPVNGKLVFLLSQPARLNDQSAQIVPMVKIFSVTNGQLESGAFVYGNDVLTPSGTHYLVRLVDQQNNLVFEQKWSIQGTTLNLGTLTPTTTGVVVPDPLVRNTSSDQSVQGPVTFSAPITIYSLTLNGNLQPGTTDLNNLGSESLQWRELYARRWGFLSRPGSQNGTVTAPGAAPTVVVTTSGGSIADGTYYAKITYVNKNGETTASAARTFTVTGGGGAASVQVKVAATDYNWASGAYSYSVYFSNDNVNFYRHSSSPVGGNTRCEVSSTVHYIRCGGDGARFTSFTFSGTTPPGANTATIDPLQVALNANYDFTNAAAKDVVLPPADGVTLTTPLIVLAGQRVSCGGNGRTESGKHRISSNLSSDKLATVMVFGNASRLEGCDIRASSSHAVMFVGNSGAQHFWLQDNTLHAAGTTNLYAALKIKGILYNLHVDNTYMRGDRAAVWYECASGSVHSFRNSRWDLGGTANSAIYSESCPTDPDLNVNLGSFPNAVSHVRLEDILVEVPTGIVFDAVNLGLFLDNVVVADPLVTAATAAVFRLGVDANGSGASGLTVTMTDSFFASDSDWTNFIQFASNTGNTLSRLHLINVTHGQTNAIDYNSVGGVSVAIENSTRFKPYESATLGKFINQPASAPYPTVLGVPQTGVAEDRYATQSLPGGLLFSRNTDRTNRRYFIWRESGGDNWDWYLGDPATASNLWTSWSTNDFTFYQSNGTSVLFEIDRAQGNLGIRRTAGGGFNGLFFPNNEGILARNAANSAEIPLIKLNTADQVEIGSTSTPARFPRTSGNPPFVVDSTTVVTNLNAQLWNGKTAIDFSGALDFASIAAQSCAELTLTATGAAANDPLSPAWPAGLEAGLTGMMYVSASSTVTVRLCNVTAAAVDPASRTFAGRVNR